MGWTLWHRGEKFRTFESGLNDGYKPIVMDFELCIIRPRKSLPRDVSQYEGWVRHEIESSDPADQDNRDVLCRPLRNCYRQLLEKYPAMNGRDRTEDDELIDMAVDYLLTKNAIVLSCAWSQVEGVYSTAQVLARKYGLIVYSIISCRLDSDPPRMAVVHRAEVYPTIFKAVWRSLGLSVGLSVFWFCLVSGVFWLVSKITSPSYSDPVFIQDNSIWIILAIAAFYGIMLLVTGVRKERKGKCFEKEIE